MLTRRKFLQYCLNSAVTVSLAQLLLPELAGALSMLPGGKPPVLWVEGTSCTGNSISLDNSADPSLRTVLEELIDLRYSQVFMWAQDSEALELLSETMEKHRDQYILVVEGGIPLAMPESVIIGERDGRQLTARDWLPRLASASRAVVAVGNCAAFGGPSMASPNPTGTKGVWRVVQNKPVINVPGCPAHPDWMVGTLAHIVLYGLPRVDEFRRPTMFFGQLVHDICPRRFHYYNGDFADAPGQAGCLYKVGCKGPITHADCPIRKFNDGVNWCINANNPCIGCAAPDFPDGGTSPFFARLGDLRLPAGVKSTAMTAAKGVGAATALGIGAHFTASLLQGRLGDSLTSTEPLNEDSLHSDTAELTGIREQLEAENENIRRLTAQQAALRRDLRKLGLPVKAEKRRNFLSRLNFFARRTKNKL